MASGVGDCLNRALWRKESKMYPSNLACFFSSGVLMNKMGSEPLAGGASVDFETAVERHLLHDIGADPRVARASEWMRATAMTARDDLAQRWVDTQLEDARKQSRRAYYLSAEFLIGRAMSNALAALGLDKEFADEMKKVGMEPADVLESEPDAAL